MKELIQSFQSKVVEYNRDGFAVVELFDAREQAILKEFATNWIYKLLADWIERPQREKLFPISSYHVWSQNLPEEHRDRFKAANRYQCPEPEVREAIISKRLRAFLYAIGHTKTNTYDYGLGDVGFRLIRPGVNDGYPLCAKDWFVAKGVTSFWIPIIGTSSNETLLIARGTHLQDLPKKIGTDKFAAGEPRYAGDIADLDLVRPELTPSHAICYHARTVHSEDVTCSGITRLNLEIRFQNSAQPMN